MGFRMNVSDNGDTTIIFKNISEVGEQAEGEILDILRREGQKIVVSKLKHIKRKEGFTGKRKRHMYQDVRARKKKDKKNGACVIISGGKETGSLWHIVNDGTYKTPATHFMDRAMDELDTLSEYVIDNVLSRGFRDD